MQPLLPTHVSIVSTGSARTLEFRVESEDGFDSFGHSVAVFEGTSAGKMVSFTVHAQRGGWAVNIDAMRGGGFLLAAWLPAHVVHTPDQLSYLGLVRSTAVPIGIPADMPMVFQSMSPAVLVAGSTVAVTFKVSVGIAFTGGFECVGKSDNRTILFTAAASMLDSLTGSCTVSVPEQFPQPDFAQLELRNSKTGSAVVSSARLPIVSLGY